MTEDIARFSATEQHRRVASGELSAQQVVEACVDAVERHGPTLNALVTLNQAAMDNARALDEKAARGEDPGPLYGVVAGIKDVTEVAGLRTTYGSPLYAEHVADVDALVVERLRRAGAVILGKTNTPEFATGGNTFNEVFGRTRNPWNPALSAGGSTGGGAAALASGMISLAEGTDLGGSLRIPASFCGVVGLRPSPGLVPTWPSSFLWDSYQVTGFIARTAADVALALAACAGPSRRSPMAQPTAGRDFTGAVDAASLTGRRLAYCRDIAGIGIDDDIEAVCRDAAFTLTDRGARVDEIGLDLSFARQPFLALRGLWMVVQQHHRLEHVEAFGDNLRGNVEAGLATATERLGAAEQARGRLWAIFDDFFARYDALLTPAMAVPPFPVEESFPATVGGREMATYIDWVAPTFVLSLSGLPVASAPCGLDPRGLPAGLQIVAPPRGEEHALALAASLQEARPIGLPTLSG